MKRIICLLCALALFGGLCPAASAQSEPLAGGRSRYEMDVTLDTDASRLTETVTVTFANHSGQPWEQVCFTDFVPAVQEHAQPGAYTSAVTAVTGIDGGALEYVSDREQCLLTVTLPQPLEPGSVTSVTIRYEADVPQTQGERFQQASFPGSSGVTYRLCQFYPMLCPWRDGAFVHHPYAFSGEAFFTECADYRLRLRLPEQFTVIASGDELLAETEDGQALWQIVGENMRDLVITATTEFAQPFTGQVDGVTINSWGTPEQAGQAERSLQIAMNSVELFDRLFGQYPYDELDICVAYMPGSAGGIEYPGLVEIIQADVSGEATFAAAVAHETAHQWFYAVVGNDQYDEPFLDEGFASFCEYLYREYVLGESREDLAADIEGVRIYMDEVLDQPGFQLDLTYGDYQQADGDGSGLHYYFAIYELSDVFFWQVRQAMGDQAFYGMLRSWYESQRFGTPTIDQFLTHLSDASGGDSAVSALVSQYMTRA